MRPEQVPAGSLASQRYVPHYVQTYPATPHALAYHLGELLNN